MSRAILDGKNTVLMTSQFLRLRNGLVARTAVMRTCINLIKTPFRIAGFRVAGRVPCQGDLRSCCFVHVKTLIRCDKSLSSCQKQLRPRKVPGDIWKTKLPA